MKVFDFVKATRFKLIVMIFIVFMVLLYAWLPTDQQTSPVQVVYYNACSLFTLNIWFGNFKTEQRMKLLGSTIELLRPSIITFQEVTSKNLAYLKQQSWFSNYYMVPDEIPRDQGYFVIILSTYPVVNWRTIPFKNSRMSRNLLLAELKAQINVNREYSRQKSWFFFSPEPIKHVYFTIATSHLESMAYSSIEREKQLAQSIRILNEYDDVCLMGDLNLEDKVDGEIQLPNPWIDAWLSVKNNSNLNGFTWDPHINTNIHLSEPDSTKDRFDRVVCKLLNFAVESIEITGKKPVDGLFFSDHFALYTKLKFGPGEMATQYPKYNRKLKFIRPKNWKKFMQ